ncbi:MAG: hypothetical protein AAFY46_01285 [Planctomycetota bacterium]
MTHTYNHAKHLLATGALNLATADLRVALVMTNTTADTELDVTSLAGFSTLDEMDGANYARQAFAGEALTKDAANNRTELDADDPVFASLGAGTRQVAGALVYQHVDGTPANDIPIAYYNGGGYPFDATGSDVTCQIDAQGFLQVR